MRARIKPIGFILIGMFVIVTSTACVRPYPGSEASAAQPTPVSLSTQPVIVPQEPVSTPAGEIVTVEAPQVEDPTPVSVEPTAEPQTEQTHTVVAGDTLFKIALEYGVTVDEIAAANNIVDINSLEVGQQLTIPAPGTVVEPETVEPEDQSPAEPETLPEPSPTEAPASAGGVHVVQPGENLFRIGLRYGCTVEQLARFNGIATPNRIPVGLEIQIPDCN